MMDTSTAAGHQPVASTALDWSVLAPKLAAALQTAGGTHTVTDVLDAVQRGRMQMWTGRKSVLVTELVQYPRLRAVRVFAGAGDRAEMLKMEKAVVDWAKSQGCMRIEGYGRHGWKRVLPRIGYNRSSVFMWRDI